MDSFDISAGLQGVLLTLAYLIPLLPALCSLLLQGWQEGELWLALACGIAGDLLLARYDDLLTLLVQRSYGALSAEVVVALLLLVVALFWVGIAHKLVPTMGQACRRLSEMLSGRHAEAGGMLGARTFSTVSVATLLIAGGMALYLWFAVPSVLVGVNRALNREQQNFSTDVQRQTDAVQQAQRRAALAVFGRYTQLQNRLNEQGREATCRDDCRQALRKFRTEISNTLIGYQIKQANADAFLQALNDPAKSAALDEALASVARRHGIPWPQSSAALDAAPAPLSPPDMTATESATDAVVASTIREMLTSPGLGKLAPALRDPVLLLAFLIEIAVMLSVLFRHARGEA